MKRRWRATLVAATGLVAPLVVMWTDGDITVFVSFGYVAPRPGFVDILRYSTALTDGAFWAGYRFWHLAGLAALTATAAAGLGRRAVAAALLAAGAIAVLRFWWALAAHTDGGVLVPVGAAWFVGAAALLASERLGGSVASVADDRSAQSEEQDT